MVSLLYLLDEYIYSLISLSGIGLLLSAVVLILLNRINYRLAVELLPILSLILIWSLLAWVLPTGVGFTPKGLYSLLFLCFVFLLLFSGDFIVLLLSRKSVLFIIFVIVFFLIMDQCKILVLNDGSKSVGLYIEPSHLAIYIMPFFVYAFLCGMNKFFLLLCVSIVAFLGYSSTFFVIVFLTLSVIYSSHIKSFVWYGFIALIIILVVLSNNILMQYFAPTIDRSFGVLDSNYAIDSQSLSSLVWLNGWSQAFETFKATLGIGLGFNSMGEGEFQYIGKYSFYLLTGSGNVLNYNDGSFLASKIISEFGILGVLLIMNTVIRCWRSIKSYIAYTKDFQSHTDISIHAQRAAGAISLFVLLFVRGMGYFVMPVFLSYIMLYGSELVYSEVTPNR